MTTDIARLVFEIDSSSAITAEKNLDKLAKTSDRVEASVRKVKTASEMAGIGIGAGSSATDRATRSAMQHAQALSQAERAMRSTIEVYGTAFNAQGRYTTSVGASTAMLLQNARASAALEKEQAATARAVQRLTSAYDPLGGEILKANAQLRDAEKLFAKGAYSAGEYARATDGLRQKIGNLETAHASGVRSSNALQNATLNLGRQFTDIGVQLAGGQNPFLVLTQQLPQIIDGLQVAKMGGLGFRQVLAGIGATLAPFLPAIIAIGTVATVAFGGAALAARSLSDDNKKLVASLGLTEKQLEHLKDKGVETGITIGDVFKGTFNYLKGAVAPTLKPIMKWFDDLFDNITKGMVFTVKAIVGGFAGAFAGVKAIWSEFPAVMGDLFASGANLAISAIEKLLNFATAGINNLIEKANAISSKVNGPQIGALGQFSLGRVDNPNAGAASKTAENAAAAVAEAYAKAGAGVDKVFAGIGAEIVKAAKARITKAAGDADKSSKAKTASETRDMSEERSAQIAAQLEQALADELRARLSMAKEVKDRAEIERQIATATASAKQSRIDAQIASIADDKGLSDLKKAELTLELQRIKFIEGGIADIQRQAINEKERADLAAEDSAKAAASAQNAIDLLQAQSDLSRSTTERRMIAEKILVLEQAEERRKLELAAVSEASTQTERDIAKARLAILDKVHASQRATENDKLQAAYNEHLNAVNSVTDAFRSRDWNGVVNGLIVAFANLKATFQKTGYTIDKVGAVAGVAAGIGGAVGGTGGAALSGAASGAMAGAAFGPWGAVIGGVLGGLGGLFGASKAKKQAKAQAAAQAAAEEAQRQQTIADTEFALNVALLRAQGEETKATNMERDKEIARLAAISQASADLQKQLWALDDAATATAKAAEEAAAAAEKAAAAAEKAAAVEARRSSIQGEIDKLTMTSAELLAKTREKERAEAVALDPTLGDLIDKLYGLQDAATASADAVAQAEAQAKAVKDAYAEQARIAEYLAQQTDKATAARAAAAAADARYENAERTRQAEAARAAAEIATKAFDDLVASVTAARNALVKAGDIAGYMAGERSINPGVSPGAYSGAGGFNAAGFNLAYSAQQSRLAQDLLRKTSASALDVKDVMGVIGGLTDIIQSPLLTNGIAAGVRAGLSDGLSAGGIDKVGVAISGLVDTLSSQAVNQAYSTDVGGITSVLAAQNKAAIAGVFGSVGGLSLMGADVIAFHTALDKLDRAFDAGQISAEDYTRATDNVRAAMGSTLDIASDFTAQQERYADALASLGRAGLDSIAYYFGQIDAAAAALAVSAAAAEEPISLVADAIGRLTSIRDVLGQSAIAAYQGGNATGSMSQAALIAQSAAIAAQALTTSDAARVAAQIAGNAAFAAVDAAGIRDASLLLDGLKAFDAKSFEAAFLRINDALIDGAINEEQYSALFGTAMATYTDEIGKTTEAFAALRSSAKSLADSLLIDPALTSLSASQQLAEAQRQYRATYNGAMGGDQQAVGAYDGAARSLLSAGKASFATREEYDLLLAGVVSDARFAQDAAPINPYIEANAPIVTELKALREEVAGLRAENKATNEKIALNTSAQRRLAEDAAVNGQLVVTE